MRTLLLISLLLPTLCSAQDPFTGRPYMLREGAKVVSGQVEIPDGHVPSPFPLVRSQGEWLDLGIGLVHVSQAVSLSAASDYYFNYLFTHPTSSWGNCKLGDVSVAQAQWDNALKDYTEAIRLDPANYAAFAGRGIAHKGKGDLAAALRDLNEAIRLAPTSPVAFNSRAALWTAKGDLEATLRDFAEAIKLSPYYASPYNNRAWLLATSKHDHIRDGKAALADATKACELTTYNNAVFLDTLAAAYAETGDFDQAINWQQKAASLVSATRKPDYESRLNLYRTNQPFRK